MAMSAPLALPAFAALPALFAPVVLMTFPPDTVIRPARLADGAVVPISVTRYGLTLLYTRMRAKLMQFCKTRLLHCRR
jgi:hypothetical protein